MSSNTMLLIVFIVSLLDSLTVEGIKKIAIEHNKKVKPNTVAAIVAIILSVAIGVGYGFMFEVEFTSKYVVSIIAMTFLSWLCSMVGYDKVMQTICQVKERREE